MNGATPATSKKFGQGGTTHRIRGTRPEGIIGVRIFLSYGHDHNEVLAARIRRDLEACGHEVWHIIRVEDDRQ